MEYFVSFIFWVFGFTGLVLAVTKYYYWMWTTLTASILIFALSPMLIEIYLYIYASLML